MSQVVIDTSVYIRYLLGGKSSATEEIMTRWKQGEFMALISPKILLELEKTLQYPRIRKFIDSHIRIEVMIEDLFRMFEDPVLTKQVVGLYQVHMVPTDPKDNIIVACAIEGAADYIVSGDENDLISLKQLPKPYQKIRILRPGEFLKILRTG